MCVLIYNIVVAMNLVLLESMALTVWTSAIVRMTPYVAELMDRATVNLAGL